MPPAAGLVLVDRRGRADDRDALAARASGGVPALLPRLPPASEAGARRRGGAPGGLGGAVPGGGGAVRQRIAQLLPPALPAAADVLRGDAADRVGVRRAHPRRVGRADLELGADGRLPGSRAAGAAGLAAPRRGGTGAAPDRHRLRGHRGRGDAVPGARRRAPFAAAHRPVPVLGRGAAHADSAHVRVRDRALPVLRHQDHRPEVAAVHAGDRRGGRDLRAGDRGFDAVVFRVVAVLPAPARARGPGDLRPLATPPAGARGPVLLPRGVRRPARGRGGQRRRRARVLDRRARGAARHPPLRDHAPRVGRPPRPRGQGVWFREPPRLRCRASCPRERW